MSRSKKTLFYIIPALVGAGFLFTAFGIDDASADPGQARMNLAKIGCVSGPGGSTGPVCGNGVIDAGEQCDQDNLDGMTCHDVVPLLYPEGTGLLACNPPGAPDECTFNVDGCVAASPTPLPAAECGDSVCTPGVEECDDEDFCGITDICLNQGGYPDRMPGCFPASFAADERCRIDLCPCGDVIEYAAECSGEGICDEFTDWSTCDRYSTCTWEPAATPTPAPSPLPFPTASPPPPSDEGSCTGYFDCDGLGKDECIDKSICFYRRAIKGCWGPPIPCGNISDIRYDFSGMHCSAYLSCKGFHGEWIYSTSRSGNEWCDLDRKYLDVRDDGTYMIEVDYSTDTEGIVTVRKLLRELPID